MAELDSGTVSILGRSFRVFGHADDAWYQSVKSSGSYREFNLQHLEHLVAQDDICLDLGANVGMITLALSILAPNGHVYAFEGSAETTDALARTVEANGLTNVSVANVVVGRTSETVRFFDVAAMRSGGHYLPIDAARRTELGPSDASLSQTKSVDQLVDELKLPRVDFIKIDVEGAELDVLHGASNTLKKFAPLVVMEFNSYAFVHLREIVPRHALQQILDTFEEVYYFKGRTGQLKLLANTDEAPEPFLHYNLNHGFVDDLVCLSKNTRLLRSGAFYREMRLADLERQIAQRDAALAEQTEKIRKLEQAIGERGAATSDLDRLAMAQQQEILSQQQAVVQSLLKSRSWKVTAPLRKATTWLRGRTK
jgi:FkbM family methyltransferase